MTAGYPAWVRSRPDIEAGTGRSWREAVEAANFRPATVKIPRLHLECVDVEAPDMDDATAQTLRQQFPRIGSGTAMGSLDHADDPGPAASNLETMPLPGGDGFVWIAAEARVARVLRDRRVKSCGHPLAETKAAGYRLKRVADAHCRLSD